jgi:hypothetical protein
MTQQAKHLTELVSNFKISDSPTTSSTQPMFEARVGVEHSSLRDAA